MKKITNPEMSRKGPREELNNLVDNMEQEKKRSREAGPRGVAPVKPRAKKEIKGRPSRGKTSGFWGGIDDPQHVLSYRSHSSRPGESFVRRKET